MRVVPVVAVVRMPGVKKVRERERKIGYRAKGIPALVPASVAAGKGISGVG
jgi:hypothetical protein